MQILLILITLATLFLAIYQIFALFYYQMGGDIAKSQYKGYEDAVITNPERFFFKITLAMMILVILFFTILKFAV